MNKNLVKTLSLVLTLVLIVAALAIPVSAADVTSDSDAKVEFNKGKLDFEDGGTVTKPPTLDFGKHNITNGAFAYTISSKTAANNTKTGFDPATEELGKVEGNLVVRDNRGTHEGWKLSLKLGDFKNAADEVVMAGSTLDFKVKSFAGPTGVTAPVGVPATNISSANVLIATAAKGAGTGAWYSNATADAAAKTETEIESTLHVLDGRQYAGAVKSQLTWTLETSA